jgi:predicted MFS family arabinose efflux permease
MALGAFVAGWVVDNFGAQNGFWVSAAAATLALLVTALGQRVLGGEQTVDAEPAVSAA